jgi:protein-arginine kinase activator protein McsA
MKKVFNIGDKVVSLSNTANSNSQIRVEGKKYIVKDIMFCPKCGMQCINIGEVAKFKQVRCECGEFQDSRNKAWTNSINFSDVDHIEKELNESVKVEDYENVAFLRDIMIKMNT